MRERYLSRLARLIVLLFVMAAPAQAADFDHVFLAAGCTSYRTNGVAGRLESKFVRTAFGVAVEHHGQSTGDLVLFCTVDPAVTNYFNFLQIAVEDNTPTGFVRATLFEKKLDDTTPPVALASVESSDVSGVQKPAWFGDLDLNEIFNYYYIEILIHRGRPNDVVRAYWAGLRDVL